MDKNAIKKYAVWARQQLIEKVTTKAVENAICEGQDLDDSLSVINGKPIDEKTKKQRKALIKKIKEEGYTQVMEEVAYTWFNRFVAIRFMEVNGYLPSHVRVFSDESGAFRPQILAEAIHLELEGLDKEKVFQLQDEANNDELFKYLLIVQCNALNEVLPYMFQKLEDYTELLLPDYLLREGSVIEKLVNEIPEDNFNIESDNGQVEIIGWMYQYYISEKHEEVVDPLHGKVVAKEEVPAATQLFTTDWVVKYLIDNSVGRYWIERNPESKLADKLEYFVKPKNDEIEYIDEKITPQDVTVFDPCVGSGHFLVYAYEVLMKIYVEFGYSERDAASEILKNNLFGVDIDGRAAQLAYFAVMMKARQYDRRFLTRGIQPHILEILESNNVDMQSVQYFCGNEVTLQKDVNEIINVLKDAKEYGSILKMPEVDYALIEERFVQLEKEISMYNAYLFGEFKSILSAAGLMMKKYSVVATNPPYFNKYDDKIKTYISALYNDYKGDLFSVFMFRNFEFCMNDGISAFMTPNVWMFIKSYEKLREFIISNKDIVTLIQMAKGAFFKEATVDVAAFVFRNRRNIDAKGVYFRLEDYKGDMEVQRQGFAKCLGEVDSQDVYYVNQGVFNDIPGKTIAYWVSEQFLSVFKQKSFYEYTISDGQNKTGNNAKFVRYFWEVEKNNIGKDKKWLPYAKGGGFRKWVGNIIDVVDWSPESRAFYRKDLVCRIIPEYLWYEKGITWGLITSSIPSFRVLPEIATFDVGGSSVFFNDYTNYNYFLGLLNSKVFLEIVQMLNPTLNFQVKDIRSMPIIIKQEEEVNNLVSEAIQLSEEDWNSFENSSDFKKHPLIRDVDLIENAFASWSQECSERFDRLKQIEVRINEIMIDNYGLNRELLPDVEDKDISVRMADREREIKGLISYAVGCMFGRYSLDHEGVVYAGGNFDMTRYESYPADDDNVIPITDDEYFEDDILQRFVDFIRCVYGEKYLEENLQYISESIGGTGTSREVIRNYFLNDFYKDHCALFSGNTGKRPIYWLFDSGKKNGFKCLIYMHRYQSDTIARIRTDYVHEQQARYRTAIEDISNRVDNATGSEKVRLNKKLNIIKAQDEEIHAYEEKIHHLADQMIRIDLDDGVKHNYEIFKDVLAKIK